MCSTMSLLVLLSIIGCVELIKVSTPHKYVNVTRGTDVLLPCTFVTSAPDTNLNIQWDFVATSSAIPKPVYYYLSGAVEITSSYEGRVQPPSSPATTNNASIIIRNIQPSDTGVYSCQVHNLPDLEGISEADIFVLVFETPSTPYCSIHGDVESGHLVTLTCHSERGSPPPTYTWIRLDQARTRRPVMGITTETGILEIRNISQFEFGEYQCTATNGEGFSTCTLELNHDDVGDGVIAGAVIGALLGCVLIVLVVWFIAHTLKKHKYKAIKVSEGNEMMSSTQAPEASDSVTMATTPSNLHAEGDGPKA
ncbi:V-set and immunoglobulin domain-containing protein 1-like isoform X2 [Notothenia coriiceps]|uniref:V-set and immunoglobulin domain-containing protein 1-like isoform X2 n=1 Tax=Notothenia coriiceps TaxID=8208 RepID=UPI000551645E|nr:PREDICTED: V-set and immunoglobulin domain-containing protein 1-like isoform X2 [Notothenia coriiceps]